MSSDIGARSLRHGHIINRTRSPTYASWRNAKTRCFNKNHEKFKEYGGRGITMCKEWADDFCAFLRDMGECPDGLTLERIDVNRGYEPGNCRWATKAEQSRNKRISITAVVAGKNVSVSQWAADLGLRNKSVWWHMKKGRSAEEAIGYLLKKRLSPRSRHHVAPGGV